MTDRLTFEAARLVTLLSTKGLTLSAAESCTGGWFAKTVVDISGASAVFFGGVVAYVNDIKERLLGVSRETLDTHTAVSAPVAREMAAGVRRLCGADIGISVTGLAGPRGGSADIPVGRVFIGIATATREEVIKLTLSGGREDIRRAAVEEMLCALNKRLSLGGF